MPVLSKRSLAGAKQHEKIENLLVCWPFAGLSEQDKAFTALPLWVAGSRSHHFCDCENVVLQEK